MHHGEGFDVGEATTQAIPLARRVRALRPPLTADRVRTIVEDVDATGPIGLDPETIAAARRLWKHFNSHGCA